MPLPVLSPAVVVGASGAIGAAFADALEARGIQTTRLSRADGLDLIDEPGIARAAAALAEPPRLVLVATGLLHERGRGPEKAMTELDPAWLARQFAVNAIGPALIAKHLLPRQPRTGRTIFAALSARVGSISDNRLGGWYGYRASKAALNQLIRGLSIEQARRNPDSFVVALHPGTVVSALSAPFTRGAERLFTPAESAGHLLTVLDRLRPEQNGQLLAWDGQVIAP